MTTASASAEAPPRLQRATSGRQVAGVAAGLAVHLGLPPLLVRAAFALLTVASGAGVAMYAALWVLAPQSEDVAVDERDSDWGQVLALGALALGGLLLTQVSGSGTGAALFPLVAAAAGVALVWRQADDAQRRRWGAGTRRGLVLRSLGGALLLVAGLAGFLATRGDLQAARDGLLSTAVVVAGLAVLSGPWWLRTARDLREERRERIRSQERAEVSAHVHDSVLQTLALIQKAAGDPREVSRLARGQERELRSWLYRPPASGQVAGAIEELAAEVELAHGTPVEVVVVGDRVLDEHLSALVSATKEAVVNAAKHSHAPVVSVFAEVEPERVVVFVRDRGRGFDADQVPEDRYGLAQSVVGRMQRHGGSARVRTAPGEGTEVRLEVPCG